MKRIALLFLGAVAACDVNAGTAPIDPTAPTNLSFQLTPSGDPNVPLGVLLTWGAPSNGRAVSYNVFGRSNSAGWLLRATTTSTTFHDSGVPQSQYYVAALNDQSADMGQSSPITIDLANRLPAPNNLASITLNRAVQLSWADNDVQIPGSAFDHYRIYSSEYNAARSTCIEPWYFEGSTVSDAFIVGSLVNGASRCFAVSAISRDGHESLWSNPRVDTPRIDAKSVVVYAAEVRADSAAFIFSDQIAKTFGLVGATRTDADFTVSRHGDGTLWVAPARPGSIFSAYAATSVTDLTSIDRAPLAGYQATPIQAASGIGYVFRLDEGDGTHYAAIRVQYVAPTFVVFDWSYQTGVGNPELSAGKPPVGLATAGLR